ncbi:cyclin-related protein [Nephila pilipes]|uniref:Cyclin-related protein n=1 Tax=Nephila pilipes TaxID=299642 RepID=A0A8X6QMV1_NEPPI|nr:cyclin-related protein [Nephila pilipes]
MEVGIRYVLEAAIKTEQNMEITSRALIIYHHFMRSAGDVFYDPSIVAPAALYLSCKVSEKEIDIDTIVTLFYHIVNKSLDDFTTDSMKFKVLRQSFITMTFLMQRMLEFTQKYRIAHEFFIPFLTILLPRARHIIGFREIMGDTCLSFMSDLYTNKVCLNYKPEHIAIASMDAALHIQGFLKDLEVIEPWYEGFCTDLTEDKVNEIKQQIFKLYKNEKTIRPTSEIKNVSLSTSRTLSQKKRKALIVSEDTRSASKRRALSISDRPSSELNGTSSFSDTPYRSLEIGPSLSDKSFSPLVRASSSSNDSSSSRSSSSGSSSDGSPSQSRNSSLLNRPFSHLGKTALSPANSRSPQLDKTSFQTSVILAERPSSQLEDITSSDEEGEVLNSSSSFSQLEKTPSFSDRPSPQLEGVLSTSDRPLSQLEGALSSSDRPSSQLEKALSISETTSQLEKTVCSSDTSSSQIEKASSLSETTSQLERISSPSDKLSSHITETSSLSVVSSSYCQKTLSSELENNPSPNKLSTELEDISSSSTEEGEVSD